MIVNLLQVVAHLDCEIVLVQVEKYFCTSLISLISYLTIRISIIFTFESRFPCTVGGLTTYKTLCNPIVPSNICILRLVAQPVP